MRALKPLLFGILNVTADSFSDGGCYLDTSKAIAHGRALAAQGANVIDIGAAASNVSAEAVSPAVEIARLAPVVAALKSFDIPISIDSFSPEVQRWALGQGVQYLNDIQGFPEPELYDALARSEARFVVMHSVQGRGRAKDVNIPAAEILDRVFAFFDQRVAALLSAGIARERLILDPGMGFFLSGDPDASFRVLGNLPIISARYGLSLLISVSRKSFLRRVTGNPPEASGSETLAAEIFAAVQGAAMLRTHDVRALRDALTIAERLWPR